MNEGAPTGEATFTVHGHILHTSGTDGIHAPPVPRSRPECILKSDPFERIVPGLKPAMWPLFSDPTDASTAN